MPNVRLNGWTAKVAALRMANDGLTVHDIAGHLRCHEQQVRAWLRGTTAQPRALNQFWPTKDKDHD